MKKLVLLLVLGLAISAQAGIVPNGGFETILYPGSTTVTATLAPAGDAWSMGVGPDCPIDNGSYEFSDSSASTTADIPGWVGYDPATWIALGGTYGRPTESGNNQGSVTNQAQCTGLNAYIANGGDWGNAAGGLIVSDAPLARPASGPYHTAMMINGTGNPALPMVLDLYVGGVLQTPDSSDSPATVPGTWVKMTRTYNTLPAGDVTLVVGVDRNATGGQGQLDDVYFGNVPEPVSMTLLGLGGLALLRRRK